LGGAFWAARSGRRVLGGAFWAARSGRRVLGGAFWAARLPDSERGRRHAV